VISNPVVSNPVVSNPVNPVADSNLTPRIAAVIPEHP